MSSNNNKSVEQPLIVGIDWADTKHDLTVIDGAKVHQICVKADPSSVENMICQLQTQASGREIAVCLENGRQSIVYHLVNRDGFTLYLVDPKQAARYRQSFVSSRAKDDRSDSAYLARLLQERMADMKPLQPNDPLTRKIATWSETRRTMVDEQTRLTQQITAKIKLFHPLVLQLGSISLGLSREFLRCFTDPRKAQKAHKLTLEKMLQRHAITNEQRVKKFIELVRTTPIVTSDASLIEPFVLLVQALLKQLTCIEKAIVKCEQQIAAAMNQHPDAELFRALPGAGAALAPRLLALYGSDRERYANAEAVACHAGIAPVTNQSGKKRQVTRRRACPKFLLQTFHEFAQRAAQYCPWSRAYLDWQRSKGVAYHAAIRKLATRWNRIIFRVWQTGLPYEPDRYMQSMKAKNHPLVQFLITT